MKPVLLSAAIAASCTLPVVDAAAAPTRSPPRDYRVSYDPARNVYCLRVFGAAYAADPRPATPGIECRSDADWAKRRITFRRRVPSGEQIG